MQQSPVKKVVAVGIGAAVFVVLGRFASIPTGIPNTSLETTYPFLALISAIFGPVVGLLVGLIGHTLKDFTAYGSPWWSWVICSGLTGAAFGWVSRKFDLEHGVFTKGQMVWFNVGQIVTNYVVWGVIAPTLDILMFSEPANKVFLQGVVAATTNAIAVGVLGTLLLKAYASTKTKRSSLKKADK